MPAFHRRIPAECIAILRPLSLPLAIVACAMTAMAYSLSEEDIVALAHYLSGQEAGQ
jgi:cytochrome c553